MSSNPVSNSRPLQPNHLPNKFLNRSQIRETIEEVVPAGNNRGVRNLFIYGPHGTGKTHLVRKVLSELPDRVQSCHISCADYDSQYKVLNKIYDSVSPDSVGEGYHTADLQRKVENRLTHIPAVIVLDDIEYLLLNDGEDLLYFLSRINSEEPVSIITISGYHEKLDSITEPRILSSLHPQRIVFDRYSPREVKQILTERGRRALRPKSLHKKALSLIANSVSNISLGLQWLRTAAIKGDDVITKPAVKQTYEEAFENYVAQKLQSYTPHHQKLYNAIEQLCQERSGPVRTGEIYQQYTSHCEDLDPLSKRRLSDFLKHVEYLGLVDANYHYGGSSGKTRLISLQKPI